MIEVSRVVPAPIEVVYGVLADGWSYASWVVGSSHIRDVDPAWPAVGSRIHHSVGAWPLQLEDTTVVRAAEPHALLSLEAQGWPLGTAEVTLTLSRSGPDETLVGMAEQIRRGPGRLIPESVQALVLGPRNEESLARLSDIAVGRCAGRS